MLNVRDDVRLAPSLAAAVSRKRRVSRAGAGWVRMTAFLNILPG
jgi:hypothetical protein